MNIEFMKESLYSGSWGTIGDRFKEVSEMFAKRCGGTYGVLMHSKTAAYETVLRALKLGYGDKVLCPDYSDRMDAEVAAAVGIAPVFAEVDNEAMLVSAEGIAKKLQENEGIKVVTVDYAEGLKLEEIAAVCKEFNCPLIVNAGTALDLQLNFDGIYAAVFDFGICGAAVTNTKDSYVDVFAWHHCGHEPGTAASISFDKIVGGDMRVSEWQAIQAMDIMKEAHPVEDIKNRGYIWGTKNPALKTVYFQKMTGYNK